MYIDKSILRFRALLVLNATGAAATHSTMRALGAGLGGRLRGRRLRLVRLLGHLYGLNEILGALIPGGADGLIPGGQLTRAGACHCVL
jgi:hypothetical protein